MSLNNNLIVIVGPTASGKTKLSLLLAQKIHGEIISADSRQIYRHLDIGTAKPSPEELSRIVHHFINILNPDQEYNAGDYGQHARSIIENLLKQGKQPILVGGSGLYIRSIIDGLFKGSGRNSEIREQLEDEAERFGSAVLYEKLKKCDPSSAAKMDTTKVRRIIRALEVYYSTGTPISKLHSDQETKPTFDVMQFGLDWERKDLYERINHRVDRMIEDGLIDEVHDIIAKGYSPGVNALNTVGYKEAFDYIGGKLIKEEMIRLIKQNTRHFAKRQLTWFRADKRIRWISMNEGADWNQIAELVINEFHIS